MNASMLISRLAAWLGGRRFKRLADQISRDIYPQLWDDAKRKVGVSAAAKAQLLQYCQVRAAQLAHARVDAVLLQNSKLDGGKSSELIVRSAAIATECIMKAAAAQHRSLVARRKAA